METTDFKFDKIMVIDDTKIDRYVIGHIMKKNDFVKEIIEYDMATKAIEYLEENYDKPDLWPQVIILDINMPEMNGFEFMERLSLLPECTRQCCTIVMLSTSLNPDDRERAENTRTIKKFVNKPLDKSKLEEIRMLYIESVLAEV